MSASAHPLDPCVHCGFCLQACPTFRLTGDEADSPRGRIVLMQQLARGDVGADDPAVRYHLDRCLGCRACEPVCPSGVAYGTGLEAARAQLARHRPPPLLARLVLRTLAEPRVRRPLLTVARVVRPLARWFVGPGRLGWLWGMLAASRMAVGRELPDPIRPATPPDPTLPPHPSHATALFTGCVMEGLFGHVNAATARTLQANGCTMTTVAGQGCCGALHAHAGVPEDARALARANVAAFAAVPDATIVVNSAGCGAALKEYGRWLDTPAAHRFAARVRDVTEVLADAGPRRGAAVPWIVATDPPCHLQHAQRVRHGPTAVLDAIPDLEQRLPADADQCCGSAGLYSLLEPGLSRQVLEAKLAALDATTPDVVASANPGCVLHIGAGALATKRRLPVVHPVELLDLSYQRAGYYDLGDPPC